MSFGFGVGDFLAVIELAKKVLEDFKSAPRELAAISDEVKSLTELLLRVDQDFARLPRPVLQEEEEGLKNVKDGVKAVLQELESFVAKNSTLTAGPRAHSNKARLKGVWARFKFNPDEVKNLRSRLTSNITLLNGLTQHLDRLESRQTQARLGQRYEKQDRQELLDWVSKDLATHVIRFNSLRQRRQPGTRKWLFESPEWQDWLRSRGGGATLYCPGMPGAGKTFTAAMAIERLYEGSRAQEESLAIAYVFCDYQRSEDMKEKEHINLARALLRMLLEQARDEDWPDEFTQSHKKHTRSHWESELGVDETFELLRIVLNLRALSKSFVVIDALDELTVSRRKLLSHLADLQKSTGLNVLITSRDVEGIDTTIGNKFSRAVKKSIQATEEDVERFLSTEMAKLENSVVLRKPQLQTEVKSEIARAAGEMFLLADLHLRSVQSCGSVKAVRKVLAALSSSRASANNAFESTMKRIQEQEAEPASKAMQALMVLTFARRPLRVDELCYALTVDLDCPDGGVDEDNLYPIEYVKSCCAGLVAVQTSDLMLQAVTPEETSVSTALGGQPSGNNVVQLAHKSIRDYLSSPESKWFSRPEYKMSLICKAFMDQKDSQQQTGEVYPFLSYAKAHWGSHHLDSLTEFESMAGSHGIVPSRRVSSNPLDRPVFFEFGFRQLAKELTVIPGLFSRACREGSLNIIDLLLRVNLEAFNTPQEDPENPGQAKRACGCKSCAVASQFRHTDVFQPETAVKDTDDEDGCTSTRRISSMIDEGVVTAVRVGRIEVIELLLAHGATLDGRDVEGFTPLGAAAWAGDADILARLLDRDLARVRDMRRVQFRLTLHRDAQDQIFFEPAKASVEDRYDHSGPVPDPTRHLAVTPLAAAAYNGHERCVEMLTSWMETHDELLRKKAKSARAGLPGDEQRDTRIDVVTSWTPDWMTGTLCAIGRGYAHMVHNLLAHVEFHSPIPGWNGMTFFRIAAKMQSSGRRVDAAGIMLEVAARTQHHDIAKKLWDSKGGPQTQADVLLFEAIHCGEALALEDYFLGLPSATDDIRHALFHRMLFRAATECLLSCSSPSPRLQRVMDGWKFEDVDTFSMIAARGRSGQGILERRGLHERCRLSSCATLLARGDMGPTRELAHSSGLSLTAVHLLMVFCSPRPLQELLHKFPALAREKDLRGRTVLMAAAASGSITAVSIVLEALRAVDKDTSSFVNEVSDDGFSAVAYAMCENRYFLDVNCMVKWLLDEPGSDSLLLFHKARNEHPSWDHETDFGEQAGCREWRPFTYLLAKVEYSWHIPGCEDLLNMVFKSLLAHADRAELSRLVMECFVDDLEITIGSFRTSERHLLEWVCRMDRADWLRYLLECCPGLETRLHVPDADGMTMLSHASVGVLRTGDTETVRFLLEDINVDPTYTDKRGCTALTHLARKMGEAPYSKLTDAFNTVAMLIKNGRGVDALLAEDEEGYSPLMYAINDRRCTQERSIFHRLLDDENTPLEQVVGRGEKLLDMALEKDNYEAVRLLLKRSCRTGFWATRSKPKPSRRSSCGFSPSVDLGQKNAAVGRFSSGRRNSFAGDQCDGTNELLSRNRPCLFSAAQECSRAYGRGLSKHKDESSIWYGLER